MTRNGGRLLVDAKSTLNSAPAFERALASPAGAVLDLAISAEALTLRQTLSQMRDAALASPRVQA